MIKRELRQSVKTVAVSMRPDQLIIQALGDMTMAIDETTVTVFGITVAKPLYDLGVGVVGGL